MTDLMSREQRKAAQARCEAATEGPWTSCVLGKSLEEPCLDPQAMIVDYGSMVYDTIEAIGEIRPSLFVRGQNGRTVAMTLHGPTNFENTAFIANSRTDLPAALATLAAYEALVGEMAEGWAQGYSNGYERIEWCAFCQKDQVHGKADEHDHACPMNHPLVREALNRETGGTDE